MSDHSLISPSMLWRIMGKDACYGSVTQQQLYPEESSGDAARLGTQLHEEAEMALLFGDDHDDPLVSAYLKYCRDLKGDGEIIPEKSVSLRKYVKDMKGTADCVIISADHLHVIDFKSGRGLVPVEGNPQLMAYALGVLEELDEVPKKITLHISQPAIGYQQGWTVTKKALKQFGRDLKEAANLCFVPEPIFTPTENNCRWCSAAPHCDVLKTKMAAVMHKDFSGRVFDPTPPEELNDEQITALLSHKSMIERYLSQIEKAAVTRLLEGEKLEAFKLGYTKTNRRWSPNAEEKMTELLGDEAFSPKKLIGISIAERLVDPKVIASLTVKPEGAPKLVLKSSSEPEYKIGSDFTAITENEKVN
jgi:hypothetical protein